MDITKIADKYGMKVNPDNNRVSIVLNKINKIKEKEFAGYCPCMTLRNFDTVCPCKYMRTKNVCRCGLYIPNNGEE